MNRRKIVSALLVLAVVFVYAIVRYNVFKGVGFEHIPLYVSNKAISLAAIFFISASYALGPLSRFFPSVFAGLLDLRKFFGLFGFGLGAVHGLISLIIFSPEVYPKFFLESGQLNFIGELSMLFGVLSFFIFAIVAYVSVPAISNLMDKEAWLRVQRLGYLGLVLVFFHVAVMGFEGWFKPSSWPGGMLPISMVAAIVIALAILLKLASVVFPKKDGV